MKTKEDVYNTPKRSFVRNLYDWHSLQWFDLKKLKNEVKNGTEYVNRARAFWFSTRALFVALNKHKTIYLSLLFQQLQTAIVFS